MLAFLAVLRVLRAAIGFIGMFNFLSGCSKVMHKELANDDASLLMGILLLLAFAVLRGLINLGYERITGLPGIPRFWGL